MRRIFKVLGILLSRPACAMLWSFACMTEVSAQHPPIIIESPLSQPVEPGGSVTLSVQASTTASNATIFGYDWTTNHYSAGTNQGVLAIDYDFFALPDTLSVYYEGILLTNTGSIAGSGRLTISFGPGKSTTLDIVLNVEGVLFGTIWSYVAALDGETLHYQWRQSGTNIVGATSNSLSVFVYSPTNGGDFDVVVTNFFGSITSEVARISVPTLLHIQRNLHPTSISVSWHKSFEGYTLRSNSQFEGLGWVTVPESTVPNGDYYYVHITDVSGRRFFRLEKP